MKIRIQGNSIRLRLSQSEVKIFGETGRVEDGIRFGPAAADAFFYALQSADVPEISAGFTANRIKILVPAGLGTHWASSKEEVGIEHLVRIEQGESLRILVEKDFKCLADRPGEDESDNFPNPNLSC